jgi:adenosylcobinamide kinase/adenosylcobinamide-phosphate guanylyltransferase
VLVGGGARSGKSTFARRWAEQRHGGGVYVATAEALDEEMRERIAHHRGERGRTWKTLEEPLDLAGLLARQESRNECVLVDCLTLWLSNVMLCAEPSAEGELARLEGVLKRWSGPDLVFVTNEVGCGIVPDNALSRNFRDMAGRLNQSVAELADEVYWTVFGQPLRVKPFGGAA